MSPGAGTHAGAKQELTEGVFLVSFPSPFLLPPLPYPSPSLPLRSRAPLNQLGDLGSTVSSPSAAPAENEFGEC